MDFKDVKKHVVKARSVPRFFVNYENKQERKTFKEHLTDGFTIVEEQGLRVCYVVCTDDVYHDLINHLKMFDIIAREEIEECIKYQKIGFGFMTWGAYVIKIEREWYLPEIEIRPGIYFTDKDLSYIAFLEV